MNGAYIAGLGSYLPKKICTNDDLPSSLNTSSEWIYQRTGILQRHLISPEESVSDMATFAAQRALDDAKFFALDIEMIVVATTTSETTFPSCAVAVQSKLECSKAFAFDVQAVCSGFIYALGVANSFIKSAQVQNALVIGAESMSSIVDWSDRSTCVLFGDGAGAVLLKKTDDSLSGIIRTHLRSDGRLRNILHTDGGVSSTGVAGKIRMNGTKVYEHAIEKLVDIVLKTLASESISVDDLDWFVPHQANSRIIISVAKRVGIPLNKVIITVEKHANTSAASIPLALDFAKKSGKLTRGNLVLSAALGGGLTWGAALFRY